jgi:hypothetical protein
MQFEDAEDWDCRTSCGSVFSVRSWGGRCRVKHVFPYCLWYGSDDGYIQEKPSLHPDRRDMLISGDGVRMQQNENTETNTLQSRQNSDAHERRPHRAVAFPPSDTKQCTKRSPCPHYDPILFNDHSDIRVSSHIVNNGRDSPILEI